MALKKAVDIVASDSGRDECRGQGVTPICSRLRLAEVLWQDEASALTTCTSMPCCGRVLAADVSSRWDSG
eukprot:CAMPEP_0203979864 /NCGR_PEP_ID=MMETSP0360-20130528/1004_1 /ASSEMBLY_ACC=CAM_ASM_000342 /TAXON_ID=268821 /ORGANISM="Scrippsiella Hangoei, Strain SHTV-5" /LENGTH=69 /DNA_ID=CAMNT_0050918205 /DNA_START=61 /DNA_END=266 /DNA_ORIENTATION=-